MCLSTGFPSLPVFALLMTRTDWRRTVTCRTSNIAGGSADWKSLINNILHSAITVQIAYTINRDSTMTNH